MIFSTNGFVKRNSLTRLAKLLILSTSMCTIFAANAADPIEITLVLSDSQISGNGPSNDTWLSGWLNLDDVVSLYPNTSTTINVTFADGGYVQIDDGFFDGSESIHIGVDGEGGTGAAPNNKADFSLLFTGVEGGLLKNPITSADLGQITINPINGNASFDKSVNLISGGVLRFRDIHLTITNRNVNIWQFDKISIGVDGDKVTQVPEPASYAMLLVGLGVILALHRRRLLVNAKEVSLPA